MLALLLVLADDECDLLADAVAKAIGEVERSANRGAELGRADIIDPAWV